jgi:hypothetical protein
MPTSSEDAFERVYSQRLWGDNAGLGAGPGSTPEATQTLSALLAHIVVTLNITSMLDVPCGAMAWQPRALNVVRRIRSIDGLDGRQAPTAAFRYSGVDIVHSVIRDNTKRFPKLHFVHADVTDEVSFGEKVAGVPPFDLVLSRAFFYHLSHGRALSALRNIKRTGSSWLLATTHDVRRNLRNATWLARGQHGLDAGGYRPVNLELSPFNLPKPLWKFVDNGGENPNGGSRSGHPQLLGLWRLSDVVV